jgi:hypothetical protein
MRNLLPLIICFFIAFICPIIISVEYKFLSGEGFGKVGTTLSMIFCILFAVGIYPKLSEHFRENY